MRHTHEYTVWTIAPDTGYLGDCIGRYLNRGHAIARLRGLRARAWRARSEMQYALRLER